MFVFDFFFLRATDVRGRPQPIRAPLRANKTSRCGNGGPAAHQIWKIRRDCYCRYRWATDVEGPVPRPKVFLTWVRAKPNPSLAFPSFPLSQTNDGLRPRTRTGEIRARMSDVTPNGQEHHRRHRRAWAGKRVVKIVRRSKRLNSSIQRLTSVPQPRLQTSRSQTPLPVTRFLLSREPGRPPNSHSGRPRSWDDYRAHDRWESSSIRPPIESRPRESREEGNAPSGGRRAPPSATTSTVP